jgi:hypothetical protein
MHRTAIFLRLHFKENSHPSDQASSSQHQNMQGALRIALSHITPGYLTARPLTLKAIFISDRWPGLSRPSLFMRQARRSLTDHVSI